MKVELDADLLFSLMQTGQIHPSQLRCLDESSKQQLKQHCLNLCQQTNCGGCQWQKHCQSVSLKPAETIALAIHSVHSH